MDTNIIEIIEFKGEGYSTLVSYDQWRVAALTFLDELKPENIKTMERHHETDEVFILVRGNGMLLLGGKMEKPGNIEPIVMDVGKLYNIKKNSWHAISLTEDAYVIIVENDNTSPENSEILPLAEIDRLYTKGIVNEFLKNVFKDKENI